MSNEELAIAVKDGAVELLSSLWEGVYKFAHIKAKNYYNLHLNICDAAGVTLEDLQQEAYFGFLEAVKAYDPEKEYSFLAFMKYPLLNSFNQICGMRTTKRNPINNAQSIYDPVKGVDDLILLDTLEDEMAVNDFLQMEDMDYTNRLRYVLNECIDALDPEQSTVIRCRYFEGLTYQEIANKTGMPRNRCRSREEKALHRLKTGENRIKLNAYREDIISCYAYKSGYNLWRDQGVSSTERTVLKREQIKEEWTMSE